MSDHIDFYPGKVLTFKVASSRVNVSRKVRLTHAETCTRLIACWNVVRDPISGWRIPTFTERETTGVLVEEQADMPAFASGIYMKLDAVYLTQDGFKPLDRLSAGGSCSKSRQRHRDKI